jgi:OmpA-OmpF porin, OOP family
MTGGTSHRALIRALAFWPALFFVSGCCCFVPSEPETVVVVVPSRHDGHVGAVVVSRGERRQLLNTAYATARAGPKGEIRHAALKPRQLEELKQTFAAASAALPPKAETYVLYFEFGTEDLTAESSQTLDTILSEVANRATAEIICVGHSDAAGTAERNLELSQRRAERMRNLVIERGAPPAMVTAFGVGSSDPEVRTADNVEEARNRRVEITVR